MDTIDYEMLVQRALYQVVCKALEATQKHGLIGDHHFLITFATTHPGVDMSKELLEEFPEEMTIILQREFWDLSVTEFGFAVGLVFGDTEETIFIPFESLIEFRDPHAQFALEFTPIDFESQENTASEPDESKTEERPKFTNNIVSLDQFRKK